MAISPFAGFILLLSSIAGVFVGIVFSRIAAEFILIVFRINEHLGATRDQGQMNPVMAGLVPASHVFLPQPARRRGCPASQTSLRSLRKADCYGRA
jgi:hypothetical protein